MSKPYTDCGGGTCIMVGGMCDACSDTASAPESDELTSILHKHLDYLDNEMGVDEIPALEAAIREWVLGERKAEVRRVYDAVKDMEHSYPEAGRTLSKGEIIKWLEFELGIGTGRNG